MKSATLTEHEEERLAALDSYSILDTLSEEDFDNLTAIASQICGTHVSLVSLIDDQRQWFKSHHGMTVNQTPKEYAFCAHAIHEPNEVFIVEDAREDERFHDNPIVTGDPHVIFYAGVPLISENGYPLGTLCVIDKEPKTLCDTQITSLKALSKQVMNLLELRKSKSELQLLTTALEEKVDQLEQFSFLAAHDLKSPLASIAGLTQLLMSNYGSKLDPIANGQLEMIQNSADRLRSLVNGLLNYNTCLRSGNSESININLESLKKELLQKIEHPIESKINWNTELISIKANHSALKTVLVELISNAIRYNFKELIIVNVDISETADRYEFKVSDNGSGISLKDQDRIFKVFQVAHIPDRFSQIGNGIGLAIAKKVIDHLGGTIKVTSTAGKGSTFVVNLVK